MSSRLETLQNLEVNNDQNITYFNTILHELGLGEEQLKSKSTLDIGSGYGRFGWRIRKLGIDCRVVDLDVSYRKGNNSPEDATSVAGNAIYLPFADGIFDLVISFGCMPRLAYGAYRFYGDAIVEEITRVSLSEAFRVSRIGGEIHMHEVPDQTYNWRRHTSDEMYGLMAVWKATERFIEDVNSDPSNHASLTNGLLIVQKWSETSQISSKTDMTLPMN
ncbi:MAG: hypothetical protein CEO21_33, partial [Microgenomates group bacterium Gr01-1014_80]